MIYMIKKNRKYMGTFILRIGLMKAFSSVHSEIGAAG